MGEEIKPGLGKEQLLGKKGIEGSREQEERLGKMARIPKVRLGAERSVRSLRFRKWDKWLKLRGKIGFGLHKIHWIYMIQRK